MPAGGSARHETRITGRRNLRHLNASVGGRGIPLGEVVEKEFDDWSKVFGGHAVQAAVGGEECVGGMALELGGEVAALAEDAAQDLGDGEDELAGGELQRCRL